MFLQVYANFFALVILISGGGLASYGENLDSVQSES